MPSSSVGKHNIVIITGLVLIIVGLFSYFYRYILELFFINNKIKILLIFSFISFIIIYMNFKIFIKFKNKFLKINKIKYYNNSLYKIKIGTVVKILKINNNKPVKYFSNKIQNKNKQLYLILSRALNPHTVIFGESGSGKTTLSKTILCNSYPDLNSIVIDFHGEYYDDLEKCGFCHINAAENVPNPFKTYGQRIPIRAMQLSFAFSRLFGFGRLQRSVLAELILDFYKQYYNLQNNAVFIRDDKLPTLKDFLVYLDNRINEARDSELKKRIHAIKSSLAIINDFIGKEENIPFRKCKRMVIDLSELTIEALQEFVADIIISEIYYISKITAQDYLVVIDEAHRLLGSEKTSDLIRQMVQEGRKYGLFLVLITQNPLDIESRILNNVSNRITFRMGEKKNLDYLMRLMLGELVSRQFTKAVTEIISGLPTGTGVFRRVGENNLIVFKVLDSHLGAESERSRGSAGRTY